MKTVMMYDDDVGGDDDNGDDGPCKGEEDTSS